jgi:hypothetical protein
MSASDIKVDVAFACAGLFLAIVAAAYWRARQAEQRARRLLNSLLTEAERRQLASEGCLEITSPGASRRVYRIPRSAGRVGMYEDGASFASYACNPQLQCLPVTLWRFTSC